MDVGVSHCETSSWMFHFFKEKGPRTHNVYRSLENIPAQNGWKPAGCFIQVQKIISLILKQKQHPLKKAASPAGGQTAGVLPWLGHAIHLTCFVMLQKVLKTFLLACFLLLTVHLHSLTLNRVELL